MCRRILSTSGAGLSHPSMITDPCLNILGILFRKSFCENMLTKFPKKWIKQTRAFCTKLLPSRFIVAGNFEKKPLLMAGKWQEWLQEGACEINSLTGNHLSDKFSLKYCQSSRTSRYSRLVWAAGEKHRIWRPWLPKKLKKSAPILVAKCS